jgi:hypothetical protein
MNHGALSTTYYENYGWNYTHNSYYYPLVTTINHAVAIVGWDDNFSRNNFTAPPPGDGAFLIKNSWGTNWADGGYGWISYHDPNIGKYNSMFVGANISQFDEVHLHDLAGPTAAFGWDSQYNIWQASQFSVGNTSYLSAVGFYTTDNPTQYQLTVYKNPTSGPVSGGEIKYSQSGVYPIAGYHVINLESPIKFNSNDKYSVVIQLINDDYKFSFPVQYVPYIKGSYNPIIYPGDSFYSLNGLTWFQEDWRTPHAVSISLINPPPNLPERVSDTDLRNTG